MRYYICRQHPTVEGPFDSSALADLVRSGSIGPETPVCPEGEQTWRALGTIPELAALLRLHGQSSDVVPIGGSGGPERAPGAEQPEIPPHWARAERPHRPPLGEMSVSNALGVGWSALTRNYWLTLLVVIILLASQFLLNLLQSFGQHLLQSTGATGAGVALMGTSFLASILVIFPLTIGALLFGVEAVRGRATLGTLARGFQRVFALLGAYLLWFLGVIVLMVPFAGILVGLGAAVGMGGFGGGGGSAALIIGLALLAMVPMLWLTARLFPTFLLIVDPDRPRLGVFQAFSTSWALTSGHALTIILLGFVVGLLVIVTFLSCVLPGIFLGYPLLLTTYGAAYCLVADRPAVVPPHPGG